MEHSFTLTDGTITKYWEYNPSKKPTIIMIHGFRGTHHGLQQIVDELPECRIIVPDLPGFGASQAFRTGKHTLDRYIDFLGEFQHYIEPKVPSIILGHSFGSIITSHFAAQYPARVKQLVLVNPIGAPALSGPRKTLTQLTILYYWIGRRLPARMAHQWLGNKALVKVMSIAMRKTKNRNIRRHIDHQHNAYFSTYASPAVVAEAFRTSVSHDVSVVAAKLSMPTLVIAGEKDDITDIATVRDVVKTIPNHQLTVISGVGHLIHYETARQAADAIRDFVA